MKTKTRTTSLVDHSKAFRDSLEAGLSKASRRAYHRDLRYFWEWARIAHRKTTRYPVPLTLIIDFVIEHSRSGQMNARVEKELLDRKLRAKPGPLRIRTLRRYLSSLNVAHIEHGFASHVTDPQVSLLLRRLQRAFASEESYKKSAITYEILQQILETCDRSARGIRDRAILLVGFASGGRRRSELANMHYEDLEKVQGGYLITLRTSKTDQAGNGQAVPVLDTAAESLRAWLVCSGIRGGKLFRGIRPDGSLNQGIDGRTINRIVKIRAKMAGLDPDQFGAHSVRSGFITESGLRGAALGDAMSLTGHRTVSVALQYYRAGALLQNPTARFSMKCAFALRAESE